MIYVLFLRGLPVAWTTESPYTGTPKLKEYQGKDGKPLEYDEAKTTPDYKSKAEVDALALRLTAMSGKHWIGFDDGPGTSHQFGVMEVPRIGDDVSYGFNGDYRPCGKITKITKGLRITATDEKGHTMVFNRKKETSGWKRVGGTWWLVKGIHDERNPHI